MTRTSQLRHLAAAGLLLVLAPAGCGGGGGEETTAPATTAPTSTETTPPPTTTEVETETETETGTETEPATPPGPPFSTAAQTGRAAVSGAALLTDVRIGRNEGFDRIVFEFANGTPGYVVRYVRPPLVQDPSGLPVTVAGDAFLSIRMEPASGFDLTGSAGETYTGPTRIEGSSAGIETLAELVRTGDFEAVLNWVAGLDGRVPFRAFVLTGPPRLVVDVQSTGE